MDSLLEPLFAAIFKAFATYSELGDGIKTTLYAAIDSYVFTYDGFASTLKITTINDETFCLNFAVQDCRYLCSMLAVRVQTGRWVNPPQNVTQQRCCT